MAGWCKVSREKDKAGQQWEGSPAEFLLSLACHLRGHQGASHTVVKETKQLIQRLLNSGKMIKHTQQHICTHTQCRANSSVELYYHMHCADCSVG